MFQEKEKQQKSTIFGAQQRINNVEKISDRYFITWTL